LQASGAPIVGIVCYRDDCQEGGRRIEALAKASPVQDADGGTAYLLYRKDRLDCVKGAPLLKGLKLKETSATNRVVATCCNSAMHVLTAPLRSHGPLVLGGEALQRVGEGAGHAVGLGRELDGD
jgi:hypothetical protein